MIVSKGLLDFSESKFALGRSIWSYSKVQAAVSVLIRNRRIQFRHFRAAEYLNIGCGDALAPGFCNLDYEWRPGVLCWDLTAGMPFADSSVRGIFSEHCLEHLSYDQGLGVLAEFRRVLGPGGVARIIVPDGELYSGLYARANSGEAVDWPYPDPHLTPMGYFNRIMRGHGHQFIYDYETLRKAMLQAGFRQADRASFRQGRDRKLLIDQEHRAVESFYVEGIA